MIYGDLSSEEYGNSQLAREFVTVRSNKYFDQINYSQYLQRTDETTKIESEENTPGGK